MNEITIKFETEKDKEAFAASVLSAVDAGVLADFDANTITRTGDTLFFTKQPEPEVAPEVAPEAPVAEEVATTPNVPFDPLGDLTDDEPEGDDTDVFSQKEVDED